MCMNRIDTKCTHFNTTRNKIKCSENCKTKACQQCKIAKKKAKKTVQSATVNEMQTVHIRI